MKFGSSFLNLHPKGFADLTKAAEELGFESVWMLDHLVFPVDLGAAHYPGAGDDSPGEVVRKTPSLWNRPLFDSTAFLCYLAGQTSTIRFGTYVYVLGIRHPFVAARAFQTLDYVPGGRAEVGIGAGWMDTEFQAAEVDFRSRGRRLDECIEVCKRLWTEEQVAHDGEFFRFDTIGFEPKPSRRSGSTSAGIQGGAAPRGQAPAPASQAYAVWREIPSARDIARISRPRPFPSTSSSRCRTRSRSTSRATARISASSTSASGLAPERLRPTPGRGKARTCSASQRRRPPSSNSGSGAGACPLAT